jgi:hypothetical protein
MQKAFYKKLVVTSLILTGLMQGWPLLVTATCSMAGPQTMSQAGNCCCCENSPSSPSPAFASCSPGKNLVGILGTDSPLLPSKDKTGHFLLQDLAVAPVADLLPPSVSLSLPGFGVGELILPRTSAAPLFLFDCTFRL